MGSESGAGFTEDKGPTILAVTWSLTVLALILVVTRLCARRRLLRNFGPDDWLIAMSMIALLAFAATATVSVVKGFGKHTMRLSIHESEQALLWNMITLIFGIISFALPKLAVAALLHRILNPTWMQCVILWTIVSIVAASALVNILIYVFMCSPPEALWTSTLILQGKATCMPLDVIIYYATFTGAFSAFADLYLAGYPVFVLSRLQMSLRRKITLGVGFSLGVIACVTAIVKCAQLEGLRDQADLTYSSVPLVIWAGVESNIVVIAACIPTLKPVLDLFLVKLRLIRLTIPSHQKYESHSFSQERVYPKSGTDRKNQQKSLDTENLSQVNILDPEDLQIRRTDEVYVGYEMKPQAQHC